jgi:peptide/nickel transport system ATP-binding protein
VSAPVLEVRDLRVDLATSRGTLNAVRGITFDVHAGETVCIVGESGCGKSMTALALMGLLPKTAKAQASRIALTGQDLQLAKRPVLNALRGNRMAMIFQEPMTALNPAWTIGSQLVEVHRRHKNSRPDEARVRAVDLLERVGIAKAADRLGAYPHQLSGGLRQRVMIAMALMCEPELLIADEPTTALDVTIQAQILRLLAELQRELGIALLLITHDLGIVARIASRVNVMYAGRIVETAPAQELFERPLHPYTRGLLSCLPRPGIRAGSRLGTIPGVVPSLVGGISGCAFRSRCGEVDARCGGAIPQRLDRAGHTYECVHARTMTVTV